MRRLFRPCGSAAIQDVLVAADLDTASEEESFEAWAAYRKAKRRRGKSAEEMVGGNLGRVNPGMGGEP